MAIGGRFDSVRGFWGAHAPPSDIGTAPKSKGDLLHMLERLIQEAHGELKALAEGRSVFIGYVENMRGQMQRCLVDIGEKAQAELRELASMDLKISDELARWYAKGVYNDFEVKEGDPADFLRAQAEYNQAMPPKIQRMIELLESVKSKLLGVEPLGSHRRPQKPYSERDNALYQLIGPHELALHSDAQLWTLFHLKCRQDTRLASLGLDRIAFRNCLYRIRKHHKIGTPKSAHRSRKSQGGHAHDRRQKRRPNQYSD